MHLMHAHTHTHHGLNNQIVFFLKLRLQGSGRIRSLTMLTGNSNPFYRWLLHTTAKSNTCALFTIPITFALECIAALLHSTHPEFHEKIKIHVTSSHIHLHSTHVFVPPADGPQLSTACHSAHINYRSTFSPATPSEHGVT